MTALDWIDSQLRLLAMMRREAKAIGRRPSTAGVDELLDARLECCQTSPSSSAGCSATPRSFGRAPNSAARPV